MTSCYTLKWRTWSRQRGEQKRVVFQTCVTFLSPSDTVDGSAWEPRRQWRAHMHTLAYTFEMLLEIAASNDYFACCHVFQGVCYSWHRAVFIILWISRRYWLMPARYFVWQAGAFLTGRASLIDMLTVNVVVTFWPPGFWICLRSRFAGVWKSYQFLYMPAHDGVSRKVAEEKLVFDVSQWVVLLLRIRERLETELSWRGFPQYARGSCLSILWWPCC